MYPKIQKIKNRKNKNSKKFWPTKLNSKRQIYYLIFEIC